MVPEKNSGSDDLDNKNPQYTFLNQAKHCTSKELIVGLARLVDGYSEIDLGQLFTVKFKQEALLKINFRELDRTHEASLWNQACIDIGASLPRPKIGVGPFKDKEIITWNADGPKV